MRRAGTPTLRWRRLALPAMVLGVLVFATTSSSLGATGSTVLVSPANDPGAPNRPTEHYSPAISADGSFVAYVGTVGSTASTDSVSSIGETGTGIFLREVGGPTIPVNVPFGIDQQGLAFEAGAPSLSSNGRFLAFASEDPKVSDEDLNNSTTLAGDTFPVRDIFVYDGASGKTELVSRNTGPRGATFNNDSNSPSISADGRYVAFGTQATNFIRGVFGGLFIRDLRTNKTTLAGRANGGRGEPLHGASSPSISAHGRWVAFVTVGPRRRNAKPEIAVRDMKSQTTVFASRGSGVHGVLADDDCAEPALSANGRYVAFATEAKNLGRTDKKDIEDVFVRDLKSDRTILVSRASGKRGAAGDGDSSNPSISANGRYITFESYASNLGPTDNGEEDPDVFVRDMRSGRITLVSRADSGGAASNAPSTNPAISASGRFVAFESRGSNLNPADTLHFTSVFRYQLLP